ncbi:hypothetical protein QFC19_001852 [Naganishia cerealis]|uniref:Uncharacterized protein n=1 Tax=Naganishia cerealis TaxID=610337 RepID=A0ACC2WEI7_9TREE|nr:hypothetical protein QFC19_001852 [Naganishia cerealis]
MAAALALPTTDSQTDRLRTSLRTPASPPSSLAREARESLKVDDETPSFLQIQDHFNRLPNHIATLRRRSFKGTLDSVKPKDEYIKRPPRKQIIGIPPGVAGNTLTSYLDSCIPAMSTPLSATEFNPEGETHTPRPSDLEAVTNSEYNPAQEDLTSTPRSGDSHTVSHDDRKSFSLLSARSSGSLSTSYSSPGDERSEVGELPDTKEHHIHVKRHSPSSGETTTLEGVAKEGDEQVEKLEQELADMNVQQGVESGAELDDDEDSYLNDPLVKYTIQLHDYTKRLYIEARIMHEKLQRERARGGRGGKSGIEAMGRKTAASRY